MGDLAVDTALDQTGDGRYIATPSAEWEIWGPMGGYIASFALRAVGATNELAGIEELVPEGAGPPFPFWRNLDAKPLAFEADWPPDGPRPASGGSGCASGPRRPSRTTSSTPPGR